MAASLLALASCAASPAQPPSGAQPTYTVFHDGTPAATGTATPGASLVPYTQTICGHTWQPGRAVPAIVALANTESHAPSVPPSSVLPPLQPDGTAGMEIAAFQFGNCATGAIVTITPATAVIADNVFYAADGSIAFIT